MNDEDKDERERLRVKEGRTYIGRLFFRFSRLVVEVSFEWDGRGGDGSSSSSNTW
jgi:hypothetical protein